jgi:hypothetical protein
LLDPPLGAAVMATGAFSVNQQSQPLLKGEFSIFGVTELLLQPVSEGGQAELDKFVEQGLDKHGVIPHW